MRRIMVEPTQTSEREDGVSPPPEVELVRWFEAPTDLAVATARTCYSKTVRYPEEMAASPRAREVRDRIARSTFDAGHHTTIQHPTFEFVLKRVSRQLIWSFLHAHPFYNSEQVSQRYVEVAPGSFATPVTLDDRQRSIYAETVGRQMAAYRALADLLAPRVREAYFAIFPGRRRRAEAFESAVERRSLEIARYVLPVASHAHLYHAISGLTLHRYIRMCRQGDVPAETRAVVSRMARLVGAIDPDFLRFAEDPVPLDETPEYAGFMAIHGGKPPSAEFRAAFDRAMGDRTSRLVDWPARGEATLADAVRGVLGATVEALPDDRAVAAVLDPALNRHLGAPLVVTTISKLSAALSHVHLVFQKRLSHTADSQDQRHRMVPGSRPLVVAHLDPGAPDYVVPDLVRETAGALDLYEASMRATWKGIQDLLDAGAGLEAAQYLLPNAFPIRFLESGSLLHLHHKWTTRLCYLAQEEIWRATREEVLDVAQRFPRIAAHLGPPCRLRLLAGETPFCPEGDRFCGVPVWDVAPADMRRAL